MEKDMQIDVQIYGAILELQSRKSLDPNMLVSLTRDHLQSLVLEVVKDESQVFSLVNQAFGDIYQNIDSLSDPNHFYPWAFYYVTNVCLSYLRKACPQEFFYDEIAEDFAFPYEIVGDDNDAFIPASALTDYELQKRIKKRLDALSILHKICIQYFYYERKSVDEIAGKVSVPRILVKKCLFDARNAVNDMIGEDDKRLYSLANCFFFNIIFENQIKKAFTLEVIKETGGIKESGRLKESGGIEESGRLKESGGIFETGMMKELAAGKDLTSIPTQSLCESDSKVVQREEKNIISRMVKKIFGTVGGKVSIVVLSLELLTTATYVVVDRIIESEKQSEEYASKNDMADEIYVMEKKDDAVVSKEDNTKTCETENVAKIEEVAERSEKEQDLSVKDIEARNALDDYYQNALLTKYTLADADLMSRGIRKADEAVPAFGVFDGNDGIAGRIFDDLDADGIEEMIVCRLTYFDIDVLEQILIYKYENDEIVEISDGQIVSMVFGSSNATVQTAYRILEDGLYFYFTEVYTMSLNEGGFIYVRPMVYRINAKGEVQSLVAYDENDPEWFFYQNNLEEAAEYMPTIAEAWVLLCEQHNDDMNDFVFSEERFSSVLFMPLGNTDPSYTDIMTFQMMQKRESSTYDSTKDEMMYAFWEFYDNE